MSVQPEKVAASDIKPNTRRGGDIRILLSPKTVGATSGMLGIFSLLPGERISEHYHPYSEEFLYVMQGSVSLQVEGNVTRMEAGDAVLIKKKHRHKVENLDGEQRALAIFHLSPLAPRPELGHVDTEPAPSGHEAPPEVM